ncbi:YaaC family protein [Marimonas arenosa]|uniref:YaaC family protein n=1 Tax=Marimonas arenosa TaxID=1795305 RepID=A0AAE3WI99_9RHOB|nr:YaaC family protein [Marimonas arenosa]MDQ2092327.1 YaaC family protein [Marimonas arenosa]
MIDGYEAALTNYRPLRYSHISIPPGADYALTADPWSYTHSFLLRGHDKRRGKNKKNFDRAIFFLELAQNFYNAADAADLPAKATLLYYGMLNMAKVVLSISGVELERTYEHHGLTLPLGTKRKVKVSNPGAGQVSIFAEFARLLGTPVAAETSVSVEDAIAGVPELHSARKSFAPDEKNRFLAIDVKFLTDSSHRRLLTAMVYDKKAEGLVTHGRIFKGKRKQYFRPPEAHNGQVWLVCQRTRTPANWRNLTRAYNSILAEYEDFDICSILTRNGYQYYLDLSPSAYHHLCNALIVMYYLGTAARYRPTEISDVLAGDLRQSVTEACALCPRQFLYQIASRITGSLCVIPYARI